MTRVISKQAEVAKELRSILKSTFPNEILKIRGGVYCKVPYIYISWDFGPTQQLVEPIVQDVLLEHGILLKTSVKYFNWRKV